mgnify:CR=1 FL=1
MLLATLGMASAQTQFANVPVKVRQPTNSTALGQGTGAVLLPIPWRCHSEYGAAVSLCVCV